MTEEKDNKEKKKLTLGGGKLSFGNKSAKRIPSKNMASGPVIVEVKGGKAAYNNFQNKTSKSLASNEESSNRRMDALKRASDNQEEETKISGLSELAQMNQVKTDPEEVEKVEEIKETETKPEKKAEEVEKKDTHKKHTVLTPKKDLDDKVEEEKVTKPKQPDTRKLRKSDLINMLDANGEETPAKMRSLASIKRARAKEKRKLHLQNQLKTDKVYKEVILPELITVGELSIRMTERSTDVIKELIKLGVMATSAQSIDADTAEIIINTFGHTVKRVKDSDVENILIQEHDDPKDLEPRAPIVTIMGHVDHGKTSLLDALKSTDVAQKESGGITQHIGAYSVTMSDNRMITFIDTPGHEAFTAMRTRGAKVTDIVVLVVAADDGIKAQTIEAISHAKAAEVPIIVAINKIDKPDADIERVKTELLSHELVSENLGGDVITVGVSALKKQNLDKLEEAILLVAEMQELKANANAEASGVVVEAKMDANKGVTATVIIQRGSLNKGDLILAGTTFGKIKRICDDRGRSVKSAGPSKAVEIYGLSETPSAGDKFHFIESEKQAREIINYRLRKAKDLKFTAPKTSLEDLFKNASGTSQIKHLPIIIKGDVNGSLEAITSSLEKIVSDEVKIKVLHSAVGAITESDITLAAASGALITGFNVRANTMAATSAVQEKVDIRYYSIIYNLIDDIKAIMSGMLSPIIREEYIGSVEVREVFNITKIGKIAGSYVTKGIIKRGAGVRLLRDDIVIYEGKLKTLKRFKDDVKEVREGYECGIAFEKYDKVNVGDKIEVFEIVEEQKKL